MLHRAYSVLEVKGAAGTGDQRKLTGWATTPTPDRMGDVIEPKGAKFKNPLPLLLFHDSRRPVGTVRLLKATDEGIEFEASIPEIPEAGTLRDRVEEAWLSVKNKLVRGVSIGFRALKDGIEFLDPDDWAAGFRFTKTEILELSLVAIPANAEAVITTIKQVDAPFLAATGGEPAPVARRTSGATDPSPRRSAAATARKDAGPMTITEQIASYEASRQAKSARMSELMEAAGKAGTTLDEEQSGEYDGLEAEVKSIDKHLTRLRQLEESNRTAAVAVEQARSVASASAARGGTPAPQVSVRSTLPPGIGFARVLMCRMASFREQMSRSPLEIARSWYPDDHRVQQFLQRGAVPAATTTDPVWAGPLVDPTNLVSEFLEYLRPMTILGKFGTGGIPSLMSVPFNVRITGQTSGGTGYWVGQGKPKPLTSFAFNAQTLLWAKVAAISVITEETARFASPSAEMLVRNGLTGALRERLDIDFIDPTQAAVAGVSPASITNGVVPLSPTGTSADAVRTDIARLVSTYITSNQDVASLVLIMPNTLALVLSLMRNSLGQPEFPGLSINGGTLEGIPVITSQYAANQSGAGNMVIAVSASSVGLADDGAVSIEVSREASLQMLDNPTNDSGTATPTTMVSMFQTNSLALRAERFINWAVFRTGAVQYLDDVNWGSIGSP